LCLRIIVITEVVFLPMSLKRVVSKDYCNY